MLFFIRRYPRFSFTVLSLGFITYWSITLAHVSTEAGANTLDVVSHLLASFTNEQIWLAGFFPIYRVLLVITFKFAFERWMRAHHPDTVLVNRLLRILSMVEKEPRRWADLEFRRQLIPMLKKAAVCLQYDLRRQCQSGDAIIDMWVQDAIARKAAALRELKK